jgi:hypothetical protein
MIVCTSDSQHWLMFNLTNGSEKAKVEHFIAQLCEDLGKFYVSQDLKSHKKKEETRKEI